MNEQWTWQFLFRELTKAVLTLVATGLVGGGVAYFWTNRQKQRERQALLAREFHQLYGEFFAIWKLWRAFDRFSPQQSSSADGGLTLADLFERACLAEGKIEAILFAIANERELGSAQIRTLGLFRQAYQRLRESIRDHAKEQEKLIDPREWDSESKAYSLFKKWACEVAELIASDTTRTVCRDQAWKQFREITDVRKKHWTAEVSD